MRAGGVEMSGGGERGAVRPRVDVVTAVHAGYASLLPLAHRSLLDQTHPHWTWLVQIDGAPGPVLAALRACGAADDPRVSVAAHGTAEGPAVTRNIALARATAPYVQNIDADDELEPDALAALSDALDAHPAAGFAVGHARDLLPDGRLREHPLPVGAGVLPRGVLPERWADRLPVHPAGTMWRRELLLALGGWSALQGMEDTGLLMAASATAEGVLVDVPTLRYRRHAAQRSTRATDFAGGGAPDRTHTGAGGASRHTPALVTAPAAARSG